MKRWLVVLGVVLVGCSASKHAPSSSSLPVPTPLNLTVSPLSPPGGGVYGELVAFHPVGGHGSALVLLPANTVKNYPFQFAKGWDVTVIDTKTTWDPSRCGVMPSVSTSKRLVWLEKPLYNADPRVYSLNVFDGTTSQAIAPVLSSRQYVESLSLQASKTAETISYVYKQLPPPDLVPVDTASPSKLPGQEIIDLARNASGSTTTEPFRPRVKPEFGKLVLRTVQFGDLSFADTPITMPDGVGVYVVRSLGDDSWITETLTNGKGSRHLLRISNGVVVVSALTPVDTPTAQPRVFANSVWEPSLAPTNAEVRVGGNPPMDVPIPEFVQRCVIAIRP